MGGKYALPREQYPGEKYPPSSLFRVDVFTRLDTGKQIWTQIEDFE